MARAQKIAATFGEAARGASRTTISLLVDHCISMDRSSRGCVARMGPWTDRAATWISDAKALLAHTYYGVRRGGDCDAAIAKPEANGALDESAARAASGFGGTHSSANHDGVSSL